MTALADRFWAKVDVPGDADAAWEDECWEWTGARTPKGYGLIKVNRRAVPSHRVAYELTIGPIPDGLVIDHLCRNRACSNPAHLEPVTPAENTLRGYGAPAANARKTHCKNGHEFTPENTMPNPEREGWRLCRTCVEARRARLTNGRGMGWQSSKTHCPHGHEYTEANTYIYQGRRFCRSCARARRRSDPKT